MLRNNIGILDKKDLQFLEVFGEGGFGKIYKVYHKQKDKYFALKKYFRFPDHQHLMNVFMEDFILEKIQALGSTEFRKYFGLFYTDPNMLYVSMMESGAMSLEDLLQMGMKFKESEVIYILKSLVNQLDVLQMHGIVNRDLKPANVIIVEDENNKGTFFYKISDFGIGCILDDPSKTMIPASDLRGLSENYASPEVQRIKDNITLSENGAYDPFEADIYSLGFFIFDLLGLKKKKKNMNFDQFPLFLKELAQKMLIIDPNKRMRVKEIKTALLKVTAKIPPNISNFIIKLPEFKLSKKPIKEQLEICLKNFKAYKEIRRSGEASIYINLCEKLMTNLPDSDKNLFADIYTEFYNLKSAWNYNSIGDLYDSLGFFYWKDKKNYNKAEEFLTKSYKINKKSYGEKYPRTEKSKKDLYNLRNEMMNLEKETLKIKN